ncbi:hypothetical protein NDS46_04860 [Paenibacillus thiaminolyticus]|nr:hypothetical protein [Paenibacillus thiaminolyticus]WCF09237.1 hypothetical protein NDS46_04860 [Paenibacillus thiaminolyticus]
MGNNPIKYVDPSGYSCEEKGNVYGKGDKKEGPYGGANDPQQWSSDKGIYSVAYEVKLPKHMYPGVSDARHFQEANRQLHEAFQVDPRFAQKMEALYPGITDG